MRYNTLRRRPKHLHSFTGLTIEEFDRLVTVIHTDWVEAKIQQLLEKRPKRKRKIGGGRKYALPNLEDQLLLVLVWIRLYPTHVMLEYLFGVDESTVGRMINLVTPLLSHRFILPDRRSRRQIRTIEELKEIIPDLDDILADATEQKVPRPQDKRSRKPYHSGKKRGFTVKTQIATNQKGFILHVSPTVGGRMHDYKLFQKSGLPQVIPKDIRLFGDSGYQGIQKDYPDIVAVLPFKRHRGKKELTRSEKIFNKKQRRIRITVENTIARLKKYQILNQTYRHSLHNYNSVFRLVSNVVNFRMLQRQYA